MRESRMVNPPKNDIIIERRDIEIRVIFVHAVPWEILYLNCHQRFKLTIVELFLTL